MISYFNKVGVWFYHSFLVNKRGKSQQGSNSKEEEYGTVHYEPF